MFDELFGLATVKQLNNTERNSAINYATILILLVSAELVTVEEIEEARRQAEKLVDMAIKEKMQQLGYDQ